MRLEAADGLARAAGGGRLGGALRRLGGLLAVGGLRGGAWGDGVSGRGHGLRSRRGAWRVSIVPSSSNGGLEDCEGTSAVRGGQHCSSWGQEGNTPPQGESPASPRSMAMAEVRVEGVSGQGASRRKAGGEWRNVCRCRRRRRGWDGRQRLAIPSLGCWLAGRAGAWPPAWHPTYGGRLGYIPWHPSQWDLEAPATVGYTSHILEPDSKCPSSPAGNRMGGSVAIALCGRHWSQFRTRGLHLARSMGLLRPESSLERRLLQQRTHADCGKTLDAY